jgi:hypothetical protein
MYEALTERIHSVVLLLVSRINVELMCGPERLRCTK